MYYTQIKQKLASIVEEASWEQTLFAMSQLAIDKEVELEKTDDTSEIIKYSKLANDLHDLSNLVG
jgi:hypothetical protein